MINASVDLKFWSRDLKAANAATHYVRPLFEGLLSPAASEP
ncbi:hypothetical protein [Phenylobacterium sp. J367]|nr:hypothetical protein [Phenylobacterium sp. J367]